MSVVIDGGKPEALVSCLTHKEPAVRVMARAVASSWSAEFQRWVEDETNRPKADHMALLQAVAAIQIQAYGSIVAQLVDKDGHQASVALYIEMTRDNMLRHIDRTVEFVRQQEEGA